MNELLNAVEATSASAEEMRQISVVTRASGNAVSIRIRDSGDAISPAVRARLFEELFTTKADGLGLGLAITRAIVERHRGQITARRRLPRGLEFSLSFPAARRLPGRS